MSGNSPHLRWNYSLKSSNCVLLRRIAVFLLLLQVKISCLGTARDVAYRRAEDVEDDLHVQQQNLKILVKNRITKFCQLGVTDICEIVDAKEVCLVPFRIYWKFITLHWHVIRRKKSVSTLVLELKKLELTTFVLD